MGMKFRAVTVLLILLFLCNDVQAQVFRKSHLAKDNAALRHQVDSLIREIEIYKQTIVQKDSAIRNAAAVQPAETVANGPRIELPTEVTDSLLSIWLLQRQLAAIPEGEYEMDSIRFTSDVPDSVLIERLTGMNSFITLPFNDKVRNYIILYTEKMPGRMSKMLGLASYYMPIFEETLSKYDLPLELKMMAVIESALVPTATSRAGAKGLWQFMFRTGRGYGLKINSYVDERMDVEKSTDAACRYLRDAYRMFGDWPLAIASYNCGPGNVKKAIKRSGDSKDFWEIYPYLKKETRGYVPAFVGALYAFTYYKEYGITPQVSPLPAAIDTFEIRKNLHFSQVSDVVGIPMETLQDLNPQYIHDIVPGNEGCSILKIPFEFSNRFLEMEDSIYRYKADSLMSPQVIKNISDDVTTDGTVYIVQSGDYLGKIAARYHVTVRQLMEWNGLRNTNLSIGQKLQIKGRGKGR